MAHLMGGRTDRFENVHLVGQDGASSDKIVVEVGLSGFKLLTPSGSHALKEVGLKNIDKWDLRGAVLTLDLKRPEGGSAGEIVLTGNARVMSELLDTLVSCCVQAAELSEPEPQPRKEAKAPVGDSGQGVRFWADPVKEGWLMSQGEHIKTWRKRWFVLKDRFLFRFLNATIDPTSRPRGVVNLSKATDVSDASRETGKSTSICITTDTDKHIFLTSSETEAVEWISAIENAIKGGPAPARPVERKAPQGSSDWMSKLTAQLESHSANRRPGPSASGGFERSSNGGSRGHGGGDRVDSSWGDIPTVSGGGSMGGRGNRDDPYSAVSARSAPGGPIRIEALDYEPVNVDALRGPAPAQYSYAPVAAAPQQHAPGPHAGYHQSYAPTASHPPTGWQVYYTDDGRPYYYNAANGQTQWDAPASLI